MKLQPIEGSLYLCLMEVRVAQRRARDSGREDLVIQLETIRQQLLEMRSRCQGI